MSSTARQNNLLLSEDWKKIYQSFRNADFKSYDYDNLRRTMVDYIRTNYPEDFNDYIESSEYLALIDLIAFIGQSIAFRVDLNARENFLETAERRESILKLARMINYNASRSIASSGLLKFNTISTTENIYDTNGANLSNKVVSWNDPTNNNWFDQFIKVMNSAFPTTQQFGNPLDQDTIYGVSTAQYRFNGTSTGLPIFNFTKTVAGRSMDFEISSASFAGKTFIYEETPKPGNQLATIYKDDGYGAGSPGTGFFLYFTQGTLTQGSFNITNPSTNEVVDISTQGINDDDLWLWQLNSAGNEDILWEKLMSVVGNNVIYNSLSQNVNKIYSVATKTGDSVSLNFADGVFGDLPLGDFKVYYRISNGLSYTINPGDILGVIITIPYLSSSGNPESLKITLNLPTTISNASATETNASIQQNAPQAYYTQNRMITGEDYNITPILADLQISKAKAVNRSSSGISRYFDLIDPTGKYSTTNLFADDGILYQQEYTSGTTFTFTNTTDIQGVIDNTILPLLKDSNLKNFFYFKYIDYLNLNIDATWYASTVDSNSSFGYLGSTSNKIPLSVGPGYTLTDFLYITSGSLLKFTAPANYYFNTKKNNALTIIPTSGVPTSGVTYLWAVVQDVTGDGTTTAGITLSRSIPTGAKITKIVPEFSTTLSSSVLTTMIDLISENSRFGLRYDVKTQAWQIIFESNLNASGNFNLAGQGSTTNTGQDASWFLLFTTDTQTYSITARELRYVFESDTELSFLFDDSEKIFDVVSNKTIIDQIKILGINNKPGSLYPYTVDMSWQVVSEYIGQDGYVDPKKILVTFADLDSNGTIDNPQLFLDTVYPDVDTEPLTRFIVQEKYFITSGQEDYRYIENDSTVGPVVIFSTVGQSYPLTSWSNGQYFYFTDTKTVVQYNSSTNSLEPSLAFKVFAGRDNLRFQYIHSANYNSRIDPSASNIIDIYVLPSYFDTAYRNWVKAGAIGNNPMPPSTDELHSMLSSSLDLVKSISDEIIYHPVNYILLFGSKAEPNLQGTFEIMINPSSAVSPANIKARMLAEINTFFALDNWDFGDTFYFSELSTFVMTKLAPDLISFVIVPTQTGQYFGSLFEIKCPSNSIFLSCATIENIQVVTGLSSSVLKTVTGNALTEVTASQRITSANYGANS
jgi:hypothetical protein